MIVGFIGARGGSKGVPNKNFRDLHGKPMIDWSLDLLFENPRVEAVVVSTDDPAIYAHALERGALDIGLRPPELATDSAGKWGVWQHALNRIDAISNVATSVFMDVDCTFPLRIAGDIDAALDVFQAERPDMVLAVAEADQNPYFNILEEDEAGVLGVSKPLPGGVVARQAAPSVYKHAGTYVLDPAYLRRASKIFEGRVIPCHIAEERARDVDTLLDWEIIKALKGLQLSQRDKI